MCEVTHLKGWNDVRRRNADGRAVYVDDCIYAQAAAPALRREFLAGAGLAAQGVEGGGLPPDRGGGFEAVAPIGEFFYKRRDLTGRGRSRRDRVGLARLGSRENP